MNVSEMFSIGMSTLLAFTWGGVFRQDTPEPTFQPTIPDAQQTIESSTVRHKINCSVTKLEDVKVIEKQAVFIGQVLCDRTEKRQQLESQKQQLELSLNNKPRLSVDVGQLELPPADFSVYESAVIAAESELLRLETEPKIEPLHYDSNMAMLVEPERFNAQQKQLETIAKARYQLAEAISDLNEAKMKRQEQEFRWLSQQQRQQQRLLIQQQEAEQQWNYQKAVILNNLQEVEEKLGQITVVKSPYPGVIRRVKVINQSGLNINVEISLIAKK